MVPSQKCYDLIRGLEACRLTAYQDVKGIWTIGWGHTPAMPGQTIDQAQADAWLVQDVATAAAGVSSLIIRQVTQNQFDAFVSFTFNVGVGAFAGSTMLALFNSGNALDAAYEFPRWSHAGSLVVKGLFIRRMKEAMLFLQE